MPETKQELLSRAEMLARAAHDRAEEATRLGAEQRTDQAEAEMQQLGRKFKLLDKAAGK